MNFTGTPGNDTLVGTTLPDNISGMGGNDVLSGLEGDDLIDSGDGNDTLDGGTGTDTASYAGASAGVVVDLVGGAAWDGAYTDTLVAIENATGSRFADRLGGDNGANVLTGGAGNDLLVGFAGADTLTGGAGADTFRLGPHAGAVDTITDFVRGAGGDVINLRDVLVGYTGPADNSSFVQLNASGADTVLSVDADGSANGANFVALTMLNDLIFDASLLADMEANNLLLA